MAAPEARQAGTERKPRSLQTFLEPCSLLPGRLMSERECHPCHSPNIGCAFESESSLEFSQDKCWKKIPIWVKRGGGGGGGTSYFQAEETDIGDIADYMLTF